LAMGRGCASPRAAVGTRRRRYGGLLLAAAGDTRGLFYPFDGAAWPRAVRPLPRRPLCFTWGTPNGEPPNEQERPAGK
jgi:hypothetical protein